MKKAFAFIISSIGIVLHVSGQTRPVNKTDSSLTYTNIQYGFSVEIPLTWKLYGQIANDTVNHRALVDWGLPVTYSELEKTTIENSISIGAYKREDLHSVDDFIREEYLRTDPGSASMETDPFSKNARIIYFTKNGLKYKGKSYYVFKNGIAYIVNFMATPGTFNINLATFDAFYNRIQFH
jgi:hypothetical protein